MIKYYNADDKGRFPVGKENAGYIRFCVYICQKKIKQTNKTNQPSKHINKEINKHTNK